MADTKISAFTDGVTIDVGDRIPVARSPYAPGDNRYVTRGYLKTFFDTLYDALGAAAAAVTAHEGAADPHPTYLTAAEGDALFLTPAEGDAAYAALVHALRHQSGGADAIKLDDLAAPDDNIDLNASTLVHGLMQKYPGGTTNFLRADGAFAAPPGGVGASWTIHEQNLGGVGAESWRGKFIITDAAVSPSSKVIIQQAPGPYTGKGTRADEAEMDPLWCVAEPGPGQATVYWRTMAGIISTLPERKGPAQRAIPAGQPPDGASSRLALQEHVAGRVRGNVKFQYTVA